MDSSTEGLVDLEFDDDDIISLAESYMAELEHPKVARNVPNNFDWKFGPKQPEIMLWYEFHGPFWEQTETYGLFCRFSEKPELKEASRSTVFKPQFGGPN